MWTARQHHSIILSCMVGVGYLTSILVIHDSTWPSPSREHYHVVWYV